MTILTNTAINAAIKRGYFLRQGNRVKQICVGENLWAEITDSGTLAWRYRFNRLTTGKPSRMSVGTFPSTPLKLARQNGLDCAAMLAEGKDPITERENECEARRKKRTFSEVVKEWFKAFREYDDNRAPKTREDDETKRDQLIAMFGPKRLITDITIKMIQDKLLTIANDDGHKAKARALRGTLREVFQYAIPKGYCATNPAAIDLFRLPKKPGKKLPTLVEPKAVGDLMRDIREYDDTGIRALSLAALELMARTFPRPNNIAAMEWAWDKGDQIVIPVVHMKVKKNTDGTPRGDHRIPLSTQARALLDRLRKITGHGKYVFSTNTKPMATKTLNRALAVLGYKGNHCVHGFRSTASTMLNIECRWPADLIELQLAHGDENKIRAAYFRMNALEAALQDTQQGDAMTDKLWQLRVKMMQHYSDRLDQLSGANVVAIAA